MEDVHELFNENNPALDVEEGELVEENKIPVSEEEKKLLRAKRFGTVNNYESSGSSNNSEVIHLHKRMGVDKNTRTEALYLLGTENMKTLDVFAYFTNCSPASIEWITENSCNATWLDEESCAKALLQHSILIKGQPGVPQEREEEEECVSIKDVRMALPPGIWRKGHFFALAPNLIIRYAKYSDRKHYKNPTQNQSDVFKKNKIFLDEGDEVSKKIRVDSNNPWVNIAMQWGHYEYNAHRPVFDDLPRVRDARELLNKREIKKTFKTRIPSIDLDENDEVYHPWEINFGKMQADIEEEKLLKHRKHDRTDLRNKLGHRSSGSSDERYSKKRTHKDDVRLPLRFTNKRKNSSESSWDSSSESEEHEEVALSHDLRKKLQKSSHKEPVKKCKLHAAKKHKTKTFIPSPLRIEIDNDIYFESENQED